MLATTYLKYRDYLILSDFHLSSLIFANKSRGYILAACSNHMIRIYYILYIKFILNL